MAFSSKNQTLTLLEDNQRHHHGDYISFSNSEINDSTVDAESFCQYEGKETKKEKIFFPLKEKLFFYELLPFQVLIQTGLKEARCQFHFTVTHKNFSTHEFSYSLNIFFEEDEEDKDQEEKKAPTSEPPKQSNQIEKVTSLRLYSPNENRRDQEATRSQPLILPEPQVLDYKFKDISNSSSSSSHEKWRLECSNFYLERKKISSEGKFSDFHWKTIGVSLTSPFKNQIIRDENRDHFPPEEHQTCRLFLHKDNMIRSFSPLFHIHFLWKIMEPHLLLFVTENPTSTFQRTALTSYLSPKPSSESPSPSRSPSSQGEHEQSHSLTNTTNTNNQENVNSKESSTPNKFTRQISLFDIIDFSDLFKEIPKNEALNLKLTVTSNCQWQEKDKEAPSSQNQPILKESSKTTYFHPLRAYIPFLQFLPLETLFHIQKKIFYQQTSLPVLCTYQFLVQNISTGKNLFFILEKKKLINNHLDKSKALLCAPKSEEEPLSFISNHKNLTSSIRLDAMTTLPLLVYSSENSESISNSFLSSLSWWSPFVFGFQNEILQTNEIFFKSIITTPPTEVSGNSDLNLDLREFFSCKTPLFLNPPYLNHPSSPSFVSDQPDPPTKTHRVHSNGVHLRQRNTDTTRFEGLTIHPDQRWHLKCEDFHLVIQQEKSEKETTAENNPIEISNLFSFFHRFNLETLDKKYGPFLNTSGEDFLTQTYPIKSDQVCQLFFTREEVIPAKSHFSTKDTTKDIKTEAVDLKGSPQRDLEESQRESPEHKKNEKLVSLSRLFYIQLPWRLSQPTWKVKIFSNNSNTESNNSNIEEKQERESIPSESSESSESFYETKAFSYELQNRNHQSSEKSQTEKKLIVKDQIKSSSILDFSESFLYQENFKIHVDVKGSCALPFEKEDNLPQRISERKFEKTTHFTLTSQGKALIPLYEWLPRKSFLFMNKEISCEFDIQIKKERHSTRQRMADLGSEVKVFDQELHIVFEKLLLDPNGTPFYPQLENKTPPLIPLSEKDIVSSQNPTQVDSSQDVSLTGYVFLPEINTSTDSNFLSETNSSSPPHLSLTSVSSENPSNFYATGPETSHWHLECEDFFILSIPYEQREGNPTNISRNNTNATPHFASFPSLHFKIPFWKDNTELKSFHSFLKNPRRKSLQACRFFLSSKNQNKTKAISSLFQLRFPEHKALIDALKPPPVTLFPDTKPLNCHYVAEHHYDLSSLNRSPREADLLILSRIRIRNPYQKPLYFKLTPLTFRTHIDIFYLETDSNGNTRKNTIDSFETTAYLQFYKLHKKDKRTQPTDLKRVPNNRLLLLEPQEELVIYLHIEKKGHRHTNNLKLIQRLSFTLQSPLTISQIFPPQYRFEDPVAHTHEVIQANKEKQTQACSLDKLILTPAP